MSWLTSRPQNRLRRHDLRGLDGRMRVRLRQHRQMKFVSYALAMALVAAGLGWGGWWLLRQVGKNLFSENPSYQIKRITVESSGPILQAEFIQARLHLQRGQNLFAVDLRRVRRDIESIPLVEHAEVTRQLPDQLQVRINERIPIANISPLDGSRSFQVDSHGMVMDLELFDRSPGDFQRRVKALPRIVGARPDDLQVGRTVASPEIIQAIALLQQVDKWEQGVSLEIGEVDVSRRGMVTLRTRDEIFVKIGLKGVDRQLRRLSMILEDARQHAQRVSTVDLTLDRDVPVTFVSAPVVPP